MAETSIRQRPQRQDKVSNLTNIFLLANNIHVEHWDAPKVAILVKSLARKPKVVP